MEKNLGKYAEALGFDAPEQKQTEATVENTEQPVKEEVQQEVQETKVEEPVQSEQVTEEPKKEEKDVPSNTEKETTKVKDNPYSVDLYDEPSEESSEKTSEKTSDNFKEKYADLGVESLDELVEKYNELQNKEPELPEGYDKLSALLSDNGDLDWNKIKEIAEVKTLDVDSMDERDLLKKYYENEGYTPKEIQVELKDYDKLKSVDKEDLYDDDLDRHERQEAKLERTLREAKKNLSSLKDKEEYNLPTIKSNSTDNSEELQKQQEQYAELRKQWEAKVEDQLTGFESMRFNLDKETTYDVNVESEVKSSIKNIMSDASQIYNDYIKDGNVDFQSMQQDLFMMKNWKTVVKSLIAQSSSKGKEDVVKELNNVDFSKAKQTKAGTDKISKTEEHILRSLL